MTDNASKLPTPTLMLVTDRRLAGGEDALVRAVTKAVEGGVNVVQLREKDLPPAELLPLACRLREVTAGRALLLVNGPLAVALEAGADGVHLPEDAPIIERLSTRFVVGRSVHSLEAAHHAADEGVDYLVVGPVYGTRSHSGSAAAGIAPIKRITAAVSVPVIGIGGITDANAANVVRAGASGIAVISAILAAPDCENTARELREVVNASWSGARQVTP